MTDHAQPAPPSPELSIAQAALACACGESTIRRAIEAGKLPARRVGKVHVLSFTEVALWGTARRLAAVGMLQDDQGNPIPYEAITG